jgi:hypothetical protein
MFTVHCAEHKPFSLLFFFDYGISKYLGLRPKLKSSLKIEKNTPIAGTFKELWMMKKMQWQNNYLKIKKK